MRIRSHLLLVTAGTLVPVLVFVTVTIIGFWRLQRAALEEGLLDRVRATSLALDRELNASVRVLQVLARSRHLDAGDLRAFHERAQGVREQERWQTIALADPTGTVLLDLPDSPGRPARAAERESLRRAAETGRPAVSSLVSDSGASPSTYVAVPVIRGNQLRYVLLARIDHASWLRVLQEYPTAGTTTTLLDEAGVVIAGTLGGAHGTGRRAFPDLNRLSRERAEGVYRTNGLDGQALYSAHSRSKAAGWTVATAAPAAAVEADLRQSTMLLLGGGAMAVLIAVGLAVVAGRRVATPASSPASMAGSVAGTGLETPTGSSREVAEPHPEDEARRLSGARFEMLARHAPIGLFQADAEGNCERVNDCWAQLMGMPADQASGASWLEAIHPDDRTRVRRRWGGAVAAREEFATRFRVPAPDGSERWMQTRALPVRDAAGELTSYVGVLVDVTEDQRAAQEQQALLEQTRTARAEAEAANQAKDHFLGAVSHELRNPLNSINLWLEVLRQQPPEAPMSRRALDGIERSTLAQAQIIDDLLDISRIVSGALQMRTDTVLLGPVIVGALDAVRPAATAKGVILDMALEPVPVAVAGDPERLHQVVLKLVSNAVKFTPRGGRVTVALVPRESSARLIVTDTGAGIDPAYLPHMFERFRQSDRAGQPAVSGLGLGLSIARRLVELHGGRIWAESAGMGKGATFSVELPRAAVVLKPPASSDRGRPDGLVALDGLRVLVVEDDPSSREGLELVLQAAGATVTAVGSVPDALEALDRIHFDVMVSDIGMPGQDGYDLMRELRARPVERGGRTRSIALTAYATIDDRRRAQAAGYEVHLPKPVTPPALTRAISELIPPRPADGPAETAS